MELVVSLNNREIQRLQVDREWREYRVQTPLELITGKTFETLTIRATNAAAWVLWKNEFAPSS